MHCLHPQTHDLLNQIEVGCSREGWRLPPVLAKKRAVHMQTLPPPQQCRVEHRVEHSQCRQGSWTTRRRRKEFWAWWHRASFRPHASQGGVPGCRYGQAHPSRLSTKSTLGSFTKSALGSFTNGKRQCGQERDGRTRKCWGSVARRWRNGEGAPA